MIQVNADFVGDYSGEGVAAFFICVSADLGKNRYLINGLLKLNSFLHYVFLVDSQRGLWSRSRHPNYFAEQGTWASFYIFSIGAGIGIVNWSIIGALLLIVLFQGSSSLAEEISGGKYPEYVDYCHSVPRYFPGKSPMA